MVERYLLIENSYLDDYYLKLNEIASDSDLKRLQHQMWMLVVELVTKHQTQTYLGLNHVNRDHNNNQQYPLNINHLMDAKLIVADYYGFYLNPPENNLNSSNHLNMMIKIESEQIQIQLYTYKPDEKTSCNNLSFQIINLDQLRQKYRKNLT